MHGRCRRELLFARAAEKQNTHAHTRTQEKKLEPEQSTVAAVCIEHNTVQKNADRRKNHDIFGRTKTQMLVLFVGGGGGGGGVGDGVVGGGGVVVVVLLLLLLLLLAVVVVVMMVPGHAGKRDCDGLVPRGVQVLQRRDQRSAPGGALHWRQWQQQRRQNSCVAPAGWRRDARALPEILTEASDASKKRRKMWAWTSCSLFRTHTLVFWIM